MTQEELKIVIEMRKERLDNMLMWNDVVRTHGGRKIPKREIEELRHVIENLEKTAAGNQRIR